MRHEESTMVLTRLAIIAALFAAAAVVPAGRAAAAERTPAPAAAGTVESPTAQLQKAKAARGKARDKAKAALIAAIDGRIESAGTAGNLDTLKSLTVQKDAFVTAGVVPDLPALTDDVAKYNQAVRQADGKLVAAYEAAIAVYMKASRFPEAMKARQGRRDLLEGKADAPAADTAEGAELILERIKRDYLAEVAEHKKKLMAAVDARLTAATEAGDLKAA